jgi:hypothetical protein
MDWFQAPQIDASLPDDALVMDVRGAMAAADETSRLLHAVADGEGVIQ